MRQGAFEKAKIMYEILKRKKEITVDDIIFQFEIAPSTAYNIAHILELMCERTGECETIERKGRKTFKWLEGTEETETKVAVKAASEENEVNDIFNAKPLTAEEDQELANKRAILSTKNANKTW
ncbi:hypothetical protein AAGT10_14910 (plasmid) [Sulfolobus tengchongensis]|uniref:Uncharacterized protein n=1 Tax=Sulfolobus tengchongensis TaxID=207809 RepID=A0AAX4L6G4_9CREN